MGKQKLKELLEPKKNELSELQRLYSDTQKQIDTAVEQGNNALLNLQDEFDELAEKKRELLRQIEKLESQFDQLTKKIKYAENTYGGYLEAIKEEKNEREI